MSVMESVAVEFRAALAVRMVMVMVIPHNQNITFVRNHSLLAFNNVRSGLFPLGEDPPALALAFVA
jgi:hypothetical protein